MTYSIRFIWGAFGRKQLKRPSPAVQGMHAAGPLFLFVPALLAVGGLAAGLAAPVMDRLLSPYAQTLPADGQRRLPPRAVARLRPAAVLTILVSAAAPRCSSRTGRVSRLRFAHSPLGNADRVTTPPCARWTPSRSS